MNSTSTNSLQDYFAGSKSVCLYDPKEISNLYLKSALETAHYNFSDVDIRNPNRSNVPNFGQAMRYEGILNKGDMLYLPSDWL